MSPSHPETPDAPVFDMSITVGENTARLAGVDGPRADEWAVSLPSAGGGRHRRGTFLEEIVGVEVADGDGTRMFLVDEHPRARHDAREARRPARAASRVAGATVTAGNAAGLNDAAAAVVLTAMTTRPPTGCSRSPG